MSERYDQLARELIEDGILTDPWLDGAPRFALDPIVLSARREEALVRAAEDVGALYDELCRVVIDEPELATTFFCLTPTQRLMWEMSLPMWHGVARVDAFFTAEGVAITEINCDTPTGEAEAVVLGARAAAGAAGLVDPSAALERRFVAMVETIARRTLDGATAAARETVGVVYPTEFTEDLSLVRLYKRWMERAGYRVVFGSPYNLAHEGDATRLFDEPIGVMLRHYKTDWWGERASAWDDDDLPDKEPLHDALRAVVAGMAEGQLAVINPFGAVLPQNKRAMAFFWEHLHRFSPRAQTTIERHVPVTSRLEALHPARLLAEQADWVIKSDYGAEGDEVVVGRAVTAEVFQKTLVHARPGRWIAQRYFEAEREPDGAAVNHGVYLVAGRAAGHYARSQVGPTDAAALSVPVLVDRPAS
ncbi:MAG: glutathionylspermidine synthase family protein [Polyangiaceae bacterium]|nr:glutathionylspermidine synthase family protein [Polyangiaceae bacterium]